MWTIPAAIFAIFLIASPSFSQQRRSNEDTWRGGIEADIRNGAPADIICINALSSAGVSNDVQFKNWAYSIVRKYCPDKLGAGQSPPSGGGLVRAETQSSACVISFSQMREIALGKKVMVTGSNCSASFN